METGSVLDAVEAAVKSMELDSKFNAGYGSVLTRDGEVQMDACIMDGKTMKIGAVTGVEDIFHPISLARHVMEKTKYNFLGSKGAMELAAEEGFKFLRPGTLITDYARDSLERWEEREFINPEANLEVNIEKLIGRFKTISLNFQIGEGNTVGAVAIDEFGNIAAATSTGGLTGKMSGRIGDAPIPGDYPFFS